MEAVSEANALEDRSRSFPRNPRDPRALVRVRDRSRDIISAHHLIDSIVALISITLHSKCLGFDLSFYRALVP
tara:strand:+ start:78 stop:296 length:219 start_codon:yes stop_codon:yes gene_type:complete